MGTNTIDYELSLRDLKRHLNIDFDDDDIYLAQLGRSAISTILRMTRRTTEELLAIGNGDFPINLQLAAMQLAAHWYRVRETVSSVHQTAVPFGTSLLVKPFVKLTND